MTFLLLCLLIIISPSTSAGARILGLFPYEGHSHFVMFESLMKELARRGHDVVVVGHFPQKNPIPNYTDRSLDGSRLKALNNMAVKNILDEHDVWGEMMYTWKIAGVDLCDKMYRHPVIQDLVHNDEKFDLLINEQWGSDCFLAFAHKFNVPHISMTSMIGNQWAMDRYGQVYNPSYIPSMYIPMKANGMSFMKRVANTLFLLGCLIGNYYCSEIPSNKIVKQHFGQSFPLIRDIAANSSLMLTNAHFSINGAIPLAPSWVDVGGLHIQEPKPLPEDLKKFLDESTNGVIVFSLGSMVKSESFDPAKLKDIVGVIRSLKQNVLWKYAGGIQNQPKNLKLVSWLPQRDVLLHKNVKLFITHGGLMGTQEAIVAGVPMIGIPFFGDQLYNVINYQDLGIAVLLEYSSINRETFSSAVNRVLSDPSFSQQVKLYSDLFKDRPHTALQTAIYWIEHVIKYKGAPHLRSSGTKLHWYQSMLLDVTAFILVICVAIVYAFIILVRLLVTCMCYGKSDKKLKAH